MKMRSILLSVLAIAVLASCAKDDGLGAGDNGDASEARVTLRLKGNGSSGPSSRAGGAATGDNSTINTLTVFFFNASGGVIGEPQWIEGTTTTDLTTTTDARTVAVIANLATNPTAVGEVFADVKNLTSLRSKLGNLLDGTTLTQEGTNLYMSGIAALSDFAKVGNAEKATATVQLRFVGARIRVSSITWNGGTVNDNEYVAKSQFIAQTNANFTIERVYLMNVQTKTQFLPNTISWSTATPPVATLGNDYITKAARNFTGGVNWADPWTGGAPAGFVQNADYTVETMPAATGGNTLTDVGHWYVFTNNVADNAEEHPTALVIETKWRSVANSTNAAEHLTRYFTVYFGIGDRDPIVAGNDYNVALKLNGSFKPIDGGGDGGGGTDDPSKPTVSSVVDITVTPATWAPVTVDKEWP